MRLVNSSKKQYGRLSPQNAGFFTKSFLAHICFVFCSRASAMTFANSCNEKNHMTYGMNTVLLVVVCDNELTPIMLGMTHHQLYSALRCVLKHESLPCSQDTSAFRPRQVLGLDFTQTISDTSEHLTPTSQGKWVFFPECPTLSLIVELCLGTCSSRYSIS
jgi:hypothetical protein